VASTGARHLQRPPVGSWTASCAQAAGTPDALPPRRGARRWCGSLQHGDAGAEGHAASTSQVPAAARCGPRRATDRRSPWPPASVISRPGGTRPNLRGEWDVALAGSGTPRVGERPPTRHRDGLEAAQRRGLASLPSDGSWGLGAPGSACARLPGRATVGVVGGFAPPRGSLTWRQLTRVDWPGDARLLTASSEPSRRAGKACWPNALPAASEREADGRVGLTRTTNRRTAERLPARAGKIAGSNS
jgi:hypothetical protein